VRFPTVTARDLEGRRCTLPDDVTGSPCVLLIAFQRWQQALIDGWLVFLEHAEERFPSLDVYEVAVLSRVYVPARPLIDGGMRSGVAEGSKRTHTLTVYTDVRGLLRSLDLNSTETIHVFVLDENGEAVWDHGGAIDQNGADGIVSCLAGLERGDSPG
jgi:hypothetical protein